MRQLMQSRGVRSVCYTLILALVSTIAPLTPFTTPAHAQLLSTYSVGVVDFINESGVQGDLLSRLATDAVVVEMGKTTRYDVGTTRTQMKTEMDRLGMRPPLTKIDLVRLGEILGNDAMLEGSIRSVQLAGSGVTRRASVTLVLQMIDQASGEITNGTVQTGESSARVGFTADDDSLIADAINSAAFLSVRTMVDYIIPEATVMMNLGESQVMLNKGVRDGIKAGMRMIILRQKEIIGYVEVQKVSATSSDAKVIKSMRGIQPEDKARAIFEMPAVTTSLKTAPLPSGAPSTGGGGGKGAIGKIGKFLVGAAIVFGLVSMFKGGRGTEDAPTVGAGVPVVITWNAQLYGHGQNVIEYQILRDVASVGSTSAAPVWVISDPSAIDAGAVSLYSLYGPGVPVTGTPVTYWSLDANPSTTKGIQKTVSVLPEPYGKTHTYQVRVNYKITERDNLTGLMVDKRWLYSGVSSPITATAIEPVLTADIITPAPDSEIQLDEIVSGSVRFDWKRKDGANVYYMTVEETTSGALIWKSDVIHEIGPIVVLPASQRLDLAGRLSAYQDKTLTWKVFCRQTRDTAPGYYEGDENRFSLGSGPPPGP